MGGTDGWTMVGWFAVIEPLRGLENKVAGVIFWAAIIDSFMIGPFMVPDGVQILYRLLPAIGRMLHFVVEEESDENPKKSYVNAQCSIACI